MIKHRCHFTIRLTQLTLVLFLALSLSACGGGSDSANGDKSDSPSADVDSGSTNDSNVPHVSVATPASGTKITQVIGGQYELSVDNSGISDPFSAPEQPTLMMALTESNELAWLGMADQTSGSLDLGPESTAFSLVMLYPMISLAYSLSPEATREAIVVTPEFGALREVLASTGDWADMRDPVVQDAYTSAIVAAASAIETEMADSEAMKIQPQSTSPQSSATVRKRMASQQDSTFEALVSVPENPNDTRSGVQVGISGTNAPAIAPDTHLNVSNQRRRWVEVIVSKNKDGSSYEDSFSLGPQSSPITWDSFRTIVSRNYPTNLIDDSTPLYVSVLGPSLSGIPDDLSLVQTQRASIAATRTMFTELAMPVLSTIFGAKTCAENIVLPLITNPVTFLSEQPDLRNHLISADYGKATLEGVAIILENTSVQGATGCVATIGSRLVPIYGQLRLVVGAIPAVIQVTDAVWSSSQSRWHEQWVFNNETLANVDVTSEAALRPPSAEYGSGGFVTTDKIPVDMQSNFSGTCDAESNDAQCLGFTFDSDPPWVVDFSVRCRHPVTSLTVACRQATFGSNTQQADGDGFVRRAIEFTDAGEYRVLIEAMDTYGARKLQTIDIQLKRTEPQLHFTAGNGPLVFSVDNDVLTVSDPLEFICCDAGQETVSRTITLNNSRGDGDAHIISVPTSDTPGFETTIPSTLTIPAGESASFEVTYDPVIAGEGEQSANITLFGHLGGRSLSPLYMFEEYSTMTLPVKGKTANFSGSWSGSETQSSDCGDDGTSSGTISISQNDGIANISGWKPDGTTFSALVSGDTLNAGTFSYPEDEGITTETGWSVTLDSSGDSISGSSSFNFENVDSGFFCSGTLTFSASRDSK